jgi:plasmid stability protein
VFDRAKEIATIGHGERKSAMMIELPEKLEAALKVQANAHGVSPAGYVCEVLERDLASSLEGQSSGVPFKTGRGMFAKYGQAPSAEEIDANRADMFHNFGEHFWWFAGVADTHTALWHLFDDKRLSAAAEAFINEAATARRKIAISTISLAEVVYLIEKNRLPQSAMMNWRKPWPTPSMFLRKPFLAPPLCRRSVHLQPQPQ